MITAINNTSGVRQFFGWIPPHGRNIDAGDQLLLPGDLYSVLVSGLNRYNRSREAYGLQRAIVSGDVEICMYETHPCTSSSSSLIP